MTNKLMHFRVILNGGPFVRLIGPNQRPSPAGHVIRATISEISDFYVIIIRFFFS